MKKTISILLIIILFTACGGPPELVLNEDLQKLQDTELLETYSNDEYNFIFAYPTEFIFDVALETTFENQKFVLKFRKKSANPVASHAPVEFSVYKNMTTDDLHTEIASPDVAAQKAGLFTTNHQFDKYEGKEPKTKEAIIRYVVVNGKTAFVGDLYRHEEQYEKLLLTILDSFNFN